ncbi:MAG: hypothetical protein H0V66_14555 [Bdellovibrionales bacterium]|nr:hypothetical protein [Bdellovibrionales bacterium]
MQSVFFFTLISIFLFTTSCGRKDQGGGKPAAQEKFEPEGIYSASLFAINKNLSSNMIGAATITKYGDEFNVRVKLRNAPAGMHMQGLYTGDSCPLMDTNGYSYLDITEA